MLKTYLKTNLANRFICLSKLPIGAPVLLVYKPNGSFYLCVNYLGLNNFMIKNWYLLSLIGKFLNWLGWTKRFIHLNLTSAYHWIRIKEGNEWKTTFKTRYGHFEYQIILFGLSNIPASFQSYINKILAKKLVVFVILYLDNILI